MAGLAGACVDEGKSLGGEDASPADAMTTDVGPRDAGPVDTGPEDTGGATCGEGTVLDENGLCVPVGEGPCEPGERLGDAGICVPFDPCAGVDCNDVPVPTGVAQLGPSAQGTACVCLPTSCAAGYVLQGGACIPEVSCPPGYRQEGHLCLPVEDLSCYDAPQSPLCIPTRCAEQPTAADGTDLAALGKCIEDPPPPPESCTNNCHNGIEDAHPWFGGPDLTCTGCHGGEPTATRRDAAHVPLPPVWSVDSAQSGRPNLRFYWNYLTLSGVENFAGGLEWLRFRNPSDLRVADQTCGKLSGCHQDRVENVRRSVMATGAGLVGVSQARNGVARTVIRQGDGVYKWDTTEGMTLGWGTLEARQGSYDATMVGSVQRLTKFEIRDRESFNQYDQIDLLKEIYDKACGDCHLGSAGANNRYADFRTSGCGACHMPYALDGRSRSTDQMISKTEPTYPAAFAQIANFVRNDLENLDGAWIGPERPHPSSHRLTKQMGSQRCGVCHSGSNRTDWQFRGYQIDPNQTALTALDNGFLNANQVQFTDEVDNDANPFARYHGQAQAEVLRFVDWNNEGLNDIPADIHFQAGMECMDCHTSSEMHNELKIVKVRQVTDWEDPSQVTDMSGTLWSRMSQATEVECVHCHGNLEYRAVPFDADHRNPIKNLIACPEVGETIPDYSTPAECQQLGRGRWMWGKFSGRWHYVPQTHDTVAAASAAIFPNGAPVYTLNASIFHGRFDGVPDDPANGVGPCMDGDTQSCFQDQSNSQYPVSQGFSHLGGPALQPTDQMPGGLECYACHATWSNSCYGCHLRLADTDGTIILHDFARSTGELTLGVVTEADVTAVSPLDMQYGVNDEGKISQFLPETKQMVAHTDAQNNQYFGTQVIVNNDANIQYNVYRDRAGYGLRQYNTELVGLPPNADGLLFDQDAQMDNNAGQGSQQFASHSVQRSHPRMDCTSCHLDANQANADQVGARWGYRPNGFANVSDYLAVLANTGIIRKDAQQAYVVDGAAGYRFDANTDPTAFVVEQQADWLVDENSSFPYVYNNHPMRETTYGLRFDPAYARAYPGVLAVDAHLAGPLPLGLLTKLRNRIVVYDLNVQYRDLR